MKRIGVIAIGDEILAGHVHESNSHFVAKKVKPMGIRLERVTTCTDNITDIVATVRSFIHEHNFDYVITSGGLGPTPDDRTMQGIAAAFDVALEQRPEHVQWMRERVKLGFDHGYFRNAEPNDGTMKMTWLPKGAEALPNNLGTALGAVMRGGPAPTILFTLPGPPGEFERMFNENVVPHLDASSPIHTEELVIKAEESRFYNVLVDLEKQFPDVQIGSYPERGQIRIRATGSEADAKAAIAVMRESAGNDAQ